jgi:hypothetical protein
MTERSPVAPSVPGAPHDDRHLRARLAWRRNLRRAFLAVSAVALAEVLGTVGFHAIEGMNWVNAFYFESMLATGQGPPLPLVTDSGKIFASIMGFVSVGSTLSAVIFTLGPIFARIWHEAWLHVEAEAHHLAAELHPGRRPPGGL